MKTKKLSEVGEGKSLTDIIGINNGAVSKMPKTSISMFNSSVITIEPGASLDVGLNLNKLILIQHNGTGHIGAFLNGVTHAQLKLISSTDPNSFGVGETGTNQILIYKNEVNGSLIIKNNTSSIRGILVYAL